MGSIVGQASLTLDGLGNTQEQLVLGIEQRLQFAGQSTHLQWLKGIRATSTQGIAHTIEWGQTFANADPQQP
ncbi:hypothetical protein D3C71_2132810 [compost metagenome]